MLRLRLPYIGPPHVYAYVYGFVVMYVLVYRNVDIVYLYRMFISTTLGHNF